MHVFLSIAAAAALAGSAAQTQVLPADAIAQAVQRDLQKRFEPGSQAQIRVSGRIADQILPVGKVRIATGSIAGRWPRTHVGVPVQLLVDGNATRTLEVWVDVHDERTVPTYAAAYPVHREGGGLSLISAVVDMSCCEGQLAGDTAWLASQRLRRAVKAGEPAVAADFESTPDVVAQQRVAVEVVRGPVHLHASGIALHDGRIGDRIEVRVDQSPDAVASRVVARQKVVVE
ncbi:MAG TPA: flagella basal body P-ring formation protein FlgA [Xanthomonadaceae bacterium]|jgi:flagella basal body P-ring formation protein FlgA